MELSVPEGELLSKRWSTALRLVMLAVVCGNVVGVCGNVAAAVYNTEAANYASSAAAAFADGNIWSTILALNFQARETEKSQSGSKMASIQQYCEVAVLLLISFAFVTSGLAFSRYAIAKLSELDLAAQGDSSAIRRVDPLAVLRSEAESMVAAASTVVRGGRQLRQVVATACVIFATFLLRTAVATMFALANQNQDRGQSHGQSCLNASNCDEACFNAWELMQNWLLYTPEFQLTVVLISSPLALLVALWGMTTDDMSKAFRGSRRMKTLQGISLLRGTASA
jgi:hypothetical protein